MRGRTNASNGGIFLNATTDDFEVATGNTIVAGDFVERVYAEDATMVSGLGASNYYNCIRLANGLYVLGNNNNPRIFSVDESTNTVTILTTLSHGYYVCEVSDNKIAVCENDGAYLYEVANNGSLTLLGSKSYSFQYRSFFHKFDENKIIAFGERYIASAHYSACYGEIVDFTDPTSISMTSITMPSNQMYNLSTAILTCGNGIFIIDFIFASSSSGSTSSHKKIITASSQDDYSKTVIGKSLDIIIPIDNNETVFFNGNAIYDSINDVTYTVSYTQLGMASAMTHAVKLSANIFLVYADKYYVIQYSDELKNFTNISSIGLNALSGYILESFAEITNGAIEWYRKTVSGATNHYYSFIVKDTSNNMKRGTPTDTVIEWAGSGNPLGVAKQSGTAGDTIQVYVPTVNS